MTIYLILLLIVFLLGVFLHVNKSPKYRKVYCTIVFVLITLISALRYYTVGIDTYQYYRAFGIISNLDFSHFSILRYEYGFTLLCKLLSYITENPQILLIVTSCFINYTVGKFIYKNSKNPMISIILYITLNVFFSSLNLMRQSMAIGFILLGFEKLKNKKWIQYSIYVIIATCFHTSSLVCLLFLLFYRFKNNRKLISITLLTSILFFIGGNLIFEILLRYIPKYAIYEGSEFVSSNYFAALIIAIMNLLLFVFGLWIYRATKDTVSSEYKESVFLSYIMATNTIVSVLAIKIGLFSRLLPFLSIFSIIWVANALSTIKQVKERILWTTIILIFTFIYFILIILVRPEWYGATPYIPFWVK